MNRDPPQTALHHCAAPKWTIIDSHRLRQDIEIINFAIRNITSKEN